MPSLKERRPQAPPAVPRTIRASGANSALTEQEASANLAAIDTLVEAIGGKAVLLDTLAVAGGSPEIEAVVDLLLDPRHAKSSIRRLCTMAGLTVMDLFAAYKKAMIVKAHLLAYQSITDQILPVVEDVMRRAAPYEIPCYECGGHGQLLVEPDSTETTTCPQCAGHGKLLQMPDLDRQKLALELAQLVQKSAGILVQQNTQVSAPAEPPPSGTLVDLQHAVRDLLRGPRQPIVDAEISATPEPETPGP